MSGEEVVAVSVVLSFFFFFGNCFRRVLLSMLHAVRSSMTESEENPKESIHFPGLCHQRVKQHTHKIEKETQFCSSIA